MPTGEAVATVELKTTAMPTPICAGYKTSEFWFSAISAIFFACVAGGAFPDTEQWARAVAIIGGALTTMGYGNVRATIKSASMPLLLVAALLLVGCKAPGGRDMPPDLSEVTAAQLLLIGYETRVEARYEAGDMSFDEYTKIRKIEAAAATALETAADAAEREEPLTRAEQLKIARDLMKAVQAATLKMVPATQPAR